MIERLEGHTGRQGPVADHRNMLALLTRRFRCHRHAQRRTDRGAGMAGTERVVG